MERRMEEAATVDPKDDDDSENWIRKTELYALIRPLMIYMEVCLLFHVRESSEHPDHRLRAITSEDGMRTKIVLVAAHTVRHLWDLAPLATIVGGTLVLTTCLFDLFTMDERTEFGALAFEFVGMGLVFQNMVNLVIMYVHCESGALLKMFQLCRTLKKDDPRLKKHVNGIVVRAAWFALITTIVVNIFNCSMFQLFLYYSYTRQIDAGCFGATMMLALRRRPLVYYAILFGAVVMAPPFALMAGFSLPLAMASKAIYDDINAKIEASIELENGRCSADPGYQSDFDVWPLFDKHRKITRSLELGSHVFGLYSLVFCVVNMTIGCFLVYDALFSCYRNQYAMAVQMGWMISGFVVMCMSVWPSVLVNTSARRSWKHLCAIRLEHMSRRHGVYLATFMERLASKNDIGISACGFFVVRAEFIIWLLSSFVSYFMVLVSLSPPNEYCDKINTLEICGQSGD